MPLFSVIEPETYQGDAEKDQDDCFNSLKHRFIRIRIIVKAEVEQSPDRESRRSAGRSVQSHIDVTCQERAVNITDDLAVRSNGHQSGRMNKRFIVDLLKTKADRVGCRLDRFLFAGQKTPLACRKTLIQYFQVVSFRPNRILNAFRFIKAEGNDPLIPAGLNT